MRKVIMIRCWVFVTFLSLLLVSSFAFAQGKGKGRRGGKPPGWEKGEKKGWQTDVPPGIEKKGGWMPPGLSKEKQCQEEGASSKLQKRNRSKKKGWETESKETEEKMEEVKEGLEETTEKQVKEKMHYRERHRKTVIKEEMNSPLFFLQFAAGSFSMSEVSTSVVQHIYQPNSVSRNVERSVNRISKNILRHCKEISWIREK